MSMFSTILVEFLNSNWKCRNHVFCFLSLFSNSHGVVIDPCFYSVDIAMPSMTISVIFLQ